jgi:hypothetical protein
MRAVMGRLGVGIDRKAHTEKTVFLQRPVVPRIIPCKHCRARVDYPANVRRTSSSGCSVIPPTSHYGGRQLDDVEQELYRLCVLAEREVALRTVAPGPGYAADRDRREAL